MSSASVFTISDLKSITRTAAGRLLVLSVTTSAFALSACSSTVETTAPAHHEVALAAASSPTSRAQAFVEAQGTYCDAATPGDCDDIEEFGLGYILTACTDACEKIISMDFAGVNARWWASKGLPALAPYSYTGSVSESRLADGRRRILATIHGHNTFVQFFSFPGELNMFVGADFTEYPLFSLNPLTPALGDVSTVAELIVPASFVGMPDVTQALFFPTEGMEVRVLHTTARTAGPLRQPYAGMPAGTNVRVHAEVRYLPKLAGSGVKSRRLIANGYEPHSRISVTKAPAK